jgi:uncharacterized protein YjbI with pentapeptide repeats
MDVHNKGNLDTLQRPNTDDQKAWKAYWETQGQPWRTEPEIDVERQKQLAERRAILPDIEKGIYPFKDIEPKLSRADVEWLLVTHENGRGPVDWKDKSQRNRLGLDLRGADLQHIDLHHLPLACLIGGISRDIWNETTLEHRIISEIHLERASLRGAHLEGACLTRAHLEGADIGRTHLESADLYRAHLEGATLFKAYLGGASLRNAYLDTATNLSDIRFVDGDSGITLLSDIHWSDANLAVVNWRQLKILGEEAIAKQSITWNGQTKKKNEWIEEYQSAVRANRQLSIALQGQGLNEEASRFANRAQKLQRIVLWRQKKFGQYLFSGFLDLLAGYGYRPGRSVIWYLVTIFAFALTYFAIGNLPFFPDAFVFSLTSFHGRGFFPGLGSMNTLHNPLVVIAAFEAVIGLVIEISFIATFTQRFLGGKS